MSRRTRLQVAGAAALLAILALALLLPARQLQITADGDTTTVSSRSADEESAVGQAGIELQPGDRVESAGDEVVVHRAQDVMLTIDGETHALRAQADAAISDMIEGAGTTLGPQDSVLRDSSFVSASAPVAPPPPLASVLSGERAAMAATERSEPVAIEVRRAVPFTVIENGQELELRSSRETVATALRDVGVRLGPGDRVQPPLNAELKAGLQVHVEHATQLVVTLPEGKAVLYTRADTVGEALDESGMALPADYRLEPAAERPISAGMSVHVVGVSEEQVLETERVPSETVYESDSSLPYGERRVVEGHDGILYREYEVVYENDELVSRELVDEWYDPEPADTIVYYSTAPEPTPEPAQAPVPVAPAAPAPAAAPSDGVVMTVWATWYNARSAGRTPSDPAYGITATGVRVDRGICAVDPSVIPLGTRFYVPGYGNCVAADTGGGIQGHMIDLGYPDGVVPNWQTGWVDITILGQ